MIANFLNYVESFCWNDKNINRSIDLQNYNNALNEARNVGDCIYCPDTMFSYDTIFQFMMSNGYQSYEQLTSHFDWLTTDDFTVLNSLLYGMMGRPTPNSSNVWEEFNEEFNEENKSLIGLKEDTCTNSLIYDKLTHEKFHSNHVTSFDYDKQKKNLKYFKKYYKPDLKIESTQITNLIFRRQVNVGIVRLDLPGTAPDGKVLHNQQVHVHITIKKNEYALNIDGTWKHSPSSTSTDRIPVEICSTLSQWGFCLPDEYY